MIPFKSILIAFTVLFCTVFSEEYIEQINPPWGYVFTKWQGDPIDVITYIPPKANRETPILIVIPGASRDAQRFHGSWLDLAKKNNFSVITIGASKKIFPDEYSYNAGNVVNKSGELVDERKWLFNVLEPIFNDFKKKYGFTSEKFYLFGHSAGGGFVHRFMLFKPDAPVIKAVSANPAFVTLPDYEIPFPFGLKNTKIKNKDVLSWLESKMAILLGEDDTGPRTKPLSNSLMAKKQGLSCLTRGKNLYTKASKKSKELNAKFDWDLIIVPGVGHDNYNLAPHACDYFFGEL